MRIRRISEFQFFSRLGFSQSEQDHTEMRVCHVINNLEVGGAEMMLHKLLGALDLRKFDCRVISLIGRGVIGDRIEALGVPVTALGMRRGLPSLSNFWQLRRAIQAANADVVQTWLFHSDLLGSLACSTLRPRPPVIWNIRHSNLSNQIDKRTTFWTVSLCARLSRQFPQRIIINSEVGRRHHTELGYAADRFAVIPNGFDLKTFTPSTEARSTVRHEFQIPGSARLVGHFGRYNPQKDHLGFIRAASQIAAVTPDAWFVMCGRGVTPENAELITAIEDTGFGDRFRLLGARDDMPRIHAAMDLTVSSSAAGEGFPNVIGEAMACGVPCVVTDVGGSAEVVGDTGQVVPPRDSNALAQACLKLLQLPIAEYETLSRRARERVQRHFEIAQISQAYSDLWRSVAQQQQAQLPLRHAA